MSKDRRSNDNAKHGDQLYDKDKQILDYISKDRTNNDKAKHGDGLICTMKRSRF